MPLASDDRRVIVIMLSLEMFRCLNRVRRPILIGACAGQSRASSLFRRMNSLFQPNNSLFACGTGNRLQAIESTWRIALKPPREVGIERKLQKFPVLFPALRDCADHGPPTMAHRITLPR